MIQMSIRGRKTLLFGLCSSNTIMNFLVLGFEFLGKTRRLDWLAVVYQTTNFKRKSHWIHVIPRGNIEL